MPPKMNKKLYNKFIEFYTPTQEQLERVFTDEEAKLICLNHECRVQMDLFNPVNDYVQKFKRKGKLQKWSEEKIQKKIIKRIKRRTEKHGEIYSESKIKKFEYEDWAQRKNFYIRWLEYYQYQQKEKANQGNDENNENSSEPDSVLEDPSCPSDKTAEQTVIPINNDQWSTPDLNNNDDKTDSGGILYSQFKRFNTESMEINTEDIQSENVASSEEDLTGIEASNTDSPPESESEMTMRQFSGHSMNESEKFFRYSTSGSLLNENESMASEASTTSDYSEVLHSSLTFSQFAENVPSASTQKLLN